MPAQSVLLNSETLEHFKTSSLGVQAQRVLIPQRSQTGNIQALCPLGSAVLVSTERKPHNDLRKSYSMIQECLTWLAYRAAQPHVEGMC